MELRTVQEIGAMIVSCEAFWWKCNQIRSAFIGSSKLLKSSMEGKPKAEDADGDFKIRVAQDMRMSVGGARYYIRLASTPEEKEA
jgi:hypothetical protein